MLLLATPDILFAAPGVLINGVRVRWIDAKATYLSSEAFSRGLHKNMTIAVNL